MEKDTNSGVEGFILEIYRHGYEMPCYVSVFDPETETGFDGFSEDKEEAVVFASREALLPLASIEVEAISEEDGEEISVFDGFRILPHVAQPGTPVVSQMDLETVLTAFEEE